MFGAIKKFFGKSSGSQTTLQTPLSPAQTPVVKPSVAKGEPAPRKSNDRSGPRASGEALKFALGGILSQLPAELRGQNPPSEAEGIMISIPEEQVINQLSKGAIKISIGDLRKHVPAGIFTNIGTHDDQMVQFPLGEALSQLKPEALGRNPNQKQVKVDPLLTDIFGKQGEGLGSMRIMDKAETLKQSSETKSNPPVASNPTTPPVVATPVATKPINTALPAPKPTPAAAKSVSTAPLATASASGGPIAFSAQTTAALNVSLAPKPKAPASSNSGSVIEGGRLTILLSEIYNEWPEPVRQEIEQTNLANSKCELPLNELVDALKQGKIQYSWRQIRGWLKPALGTDKPSPLANTLLDLPLKVLAPIFLSQNKAATSKQALVPNDIPDVFNKAPSAPASAPAKAQAAAPAKPAAIATREKIAPLSLKLSDLSAKWPEPLRQEINDLKLSGATLEVPFEAIESGLKTGNVGFLWKQICQWIKNCPAKASATTFAEIRLEFPLALVAPLFLKARPAQEQKQAVVPVNIPDLFNAGNEAAAATSAAPATPVPAVSAAPVSPQPVAEVIAKKAPENLAELFGEPDKRNWTPNDIVHKTSHLPGVAGALIALQDGLLVASCMPPDWKTETIAAFLPQIFGRMHQYTKELKMGELQSVTFSVDQGTLQIYNAGIIYFSVLGRNQVPLPLAELHLIARELSRHTK